MDIISEIQAVLRDYQSQITPTISTVEQIAIRQQIAAKENHLREFYKLLPREGENLLLFPFKHKTLSYVLIKF
jgi:hypothetical protein